MYNLVTQKILNDANNRKFGGDNFSSRDNENQMDMLANMSFDSYNSSDDNDDHNNN